MNSARDISLSSGTKQLAPIELCEGAQRVSKPGALKARCSRCGWHFEVQASQAVNALRCPLCDKPKRID